MIRRHNATPRGSRSRNGTPDSQATPPGVTPASHPEAPKAEAVGEVLGADGGAGSAEVGAGSVVLEAALPLTTTPPVGDLPPALPPAGPAPPAWLRCAPGAPRPAWLDKRSRERAARPKGLACPRIDAREVLAKLRGGNARANGGPYSAGQRALAQMAMGAGLPPSSIPARLVKEALASRWGVGGKRSAATRWARGLYGPAVTSMDLVRALVAAHGRKGRAGRTRTA